MKTNISIYDKNGELLNVNDEIFDGYDNNTLEVYDNGWCICSKKSIWRIEEFVKEGAEA